MNYLPDWPKEVPKWNSETISLLDKPPNHSTHVNLVKFMEHSDRFPIKFPIETIRCKSIKNVVSDKVLETNINSAYPLIHENALKLCAQFLLHKRNFGTASEKEFYKNMTVLGFIERLLTKRAVMFMGKFDKYILLDGTTGTGKWNLINKDDGQSKLQLKDCLSYDEIKVSVFLSVSSYSYFINDGTRKNFGKVAENRNRIQDEGVVIGVIGARLKKIGAMEYEEMVISRTQNSAKNGYGVSPESLHSVFSRFYDEPCFTYITMMEQKEKEPLRFIELQKGIYFDNVVYSKRIALSIDTLLLEANHRAKLKNCFAFIHVVGIGLGVWKCSPHQEEIFMETFALRLSSLGPKLSSISDVYFSYFTKSDNCGGHKNGSIMEVQTHPNNGIKIHIGKRDPHVKLSGEDEGKLLIVSYAWDGNALPGNEFWDGKLGSTGDSAAAASTQITEIHNSHINPNVCAQNLHIVTSSGLITYSKYYKTIVNKKRKHSSDEN